MGKIARGIAVVLLMGLSYANAAEVYAPDSTEVAGDTTRLPTDTISIPRIALISGVTLGGFLYGHVVLSNLWWKGEKSDFHFDWDHDWRYSLGADKLGHAYFPYLTTNIYSQAFVWSGIDTTTSLWLASSLALTYQTYIEIRDGFSKEWGFSWGDCAANVLGASYPLVQHYISPLRNYHFKISFFPSEKFRAGSNNAIIDDYESAYHWISVDVHKILPQTWRDYWPPWINIAVGHSVKNLDGFGGGEHEVYLSLDWNLEGLPGDGWLWRLLKHNLNFYHLPAPAVRIAPGVVWYGVHF
jgi:hypothetical protein